MKKAFGFLLSALIATVGLLAGDLSITYKTHGKVMGMSFDAVQTHYYSGNFHKSVDEKNKVDQLVDFGKGAFYTIKHKDKKVEMMTFDDMEKVMEATAAKLNAVGADMPAFLKGMMGGGDAKAEVKVEKTGTETVLGRTCQKYHITCGKMVWDSSNDASLKPPVSPAAFARFTKLKGSLNPMGSEGLRKMYEEMSKVQGMALKTAMKGFMGGDSTMEAMDVKTTPIPAATFVLPAGYPVEDTGKKMLKDMQKH